MNKKFINDKFADQIIDEIKKDKSILDDLYIEELEYLDQYLDEYTKYLIENKGENNE